MNVALEQSLETINHMCSFDISLNNIDNLIFILKRTEQKIYECRRQRMNELTQYQESCKEADSVYSYEENTSTGSKAQRRGMQQLNSREETRYGALSLSLTEPDNSHKSSFHLHEKNVGKYQGQIQEVAHWVELLTNVRPLHEKLMSPERKKKTPHEIEQLVVSKQERATKVRRALDLQRTERLARAAGGRCAIRKTAEHRRECMTRELHERHQRAEGLHKAHIEGVVQRATAENRKVDEVHFIQSLNNKNRKLCLQQRLNEADERRQALLQAAIHKNRENDSAVLWAQERKKAREDERRAKLRAEQQRKEEQHVKLEQRRAAMEREMSARRRERERRRVQRRADSANSDSRARALEERLKEATMRRLAHLENIKERAAITKDDRRDMLSPTMLDSVQPPLGIHQLARCLKESWTSIPLHEMHTEVVLTKEPEGVHEKRRVDNEMLSRRSQQLLLRFQLHTVPQFFAFTDDMALKTVQQMLNELLNAHKAKNITISNLIANHLVTWLQRQDQDGLKSFSHTGLFDKIVCSFINPASNHEQGISLDLKVELMSSIMRLVPLWCENESDFAFIAQLFRPVAYIFSDAIRTYDNVLKESVHMKGSADLDNILSMFLQTFTLDTQCTSMVIAVRADFSELLLLLGLFKQLQSIFGSSYHPHSTAPDCFPPTVEVGIRVVELVISMQCLLPTTSLPALHGEFSREGILLHSLRESNFCGLPSLLTVALLHAEGLLATADTQLQISIVEMLPPNFVPVATGILHTLNSAARLNFRAVQSILGAHSLRIETHHLFSFLISFCTEQHETSESISGLLAETLVFMGYFALMHSHNQEVLRWGKSPTLLQRLCSVPFSYFSDPKRIRLLYPTLISVCFQNELNREVLERETDLQLVLEFLHDEMKGGDAGIDDFHLQFSTDNEAYYKMNTRIPQCYWHQIDVFLSRKC